MLTPVELLLIKTYAAYLPDQGRALQALEDTVAWGVEADLINTSVRGVAQEIEARLAQDPTWWRPRPTWAPKEEA